MRNVIQRTYDEFGKASGSAKKSGSWYRRSDETIFVFNLQKSQYAPSYYINVGLWLLAVGPAEAPKPHQCHIQTRLDDLVPPAMEGRLTALLDLESPIDDGLRRGELLGMFHEYLQPVMDACSSLDGLRSDVGIRFIKASLLTGDAQRLLAR